MCRSPPPIWPALKKTCRESDTNRRANCNTVTLLTVPYSIASEKRPMKFNSCSRCCKGTLKRQEKSQGQTMNTTRMHAWKKWLRYTVAAAALQSAIATVPSFADEGDRDQKTATPIRHLV